MTTSGATNWRVVLCLLTAVILGQSRAVVPKERKQDAEIEDKNRDTKEVEDSIELMSRRITQAVHSSLGTDVANDRRKEQTELRDRSLKEIKPQLDLSALRSTGNSGSTALLNTVGRARIDRDALHRNRFARACVGDEECSSMGKIPISTDVERMAHVSTFAGMVLQVYRQNIVSDIENEISKHARKEGGGRETQKREKDEEENLPVCRAPTGIQIVDDQPSRSETSPSHLLDRSYELVEPLHAELGIAPKHTMDFAYTPVVHQDKREKPVHDDLELDIDDGAFDDPEFKAVIQGSESATSSSWWQWWFSFTTSNWWHNRGSSKTDYDMGKTAFAGGSHGEVWRGRRKCKHAENAGRKMMPGESQHGDNPDCDESEPLILKRLRVEKGYRLLEAGLREVYFGSFLTPQADSLCTVYVDHFFREIPKATFARRTPRSADSSKDLELWVVFKDAGKSLNSFLYSTVTSESGFVMFQQSPLWVKMRMESFGQENKTKSAVSTHHSERRERRERREQIWGRDGTEKRFSSTTLSGQGFLRKILEDVLTAAAFLHDHGLVHRDIKPSNLMCTSDIDVDTSGRLGIYPNLHCVLGDFSSAWNTFTDQHLYTNGPSPGEQTDEYAPPEAFIGKDWIPFSEKAPQSYDSWSIGVLALELLLGTPNVFSVDQRTTVLLTNQMRREGASDDELQRALYLAALSQFCIYVPSAETQHTWPFRRGGPLHKISMVKEKCTLDDFHRALRARDPLGTGFDKSADLLLHLIWQLLAWEPTDRITAKDALQHPYFTSARDGKPESIDLVPGWNNAVESQMLDPRMDFNLSDRVSEFQCPKCGRVFTDWHSCHIHARSRRHSKFCTYDTKSLPTCVNAHSMLPAHASSGYCDLQGRRPTIEDFHSIQIHQSNQFYGIFDGHTGNLASKFAASTLYTQLVQHLPSLQEMATAQLPGWKEQVKTNVTRAFVDAHENFLTAVRLMPASTMDQSGTTATALLVTDDAVIIASLGDSRAVLASSTTCSEKERSELTAIALTRDHVASDPYEKDLVEARGGFVSMGKGTQRVNGTLAITRSIGDAYLAPLLSRFPDVTSMTREELRERCGADPCIVILASDGLWDEISNQEAVEMVQFVIESSTATDVSQSGVYQVAAEALAIEAYVRGSTDNIGVCVVAID